MGGGKINSLNAQETTFTIGGESDTYTSFYPVYFSYGPQKFSYSQQIYLESEMQVRSGQITHIAFEKCRGTKNHNRNVKVYIESTTLESFPANPGITDWYTVTTDPVFDGSVEWGYAEGWVTIELDTPFEYRGGNIIVSVLDKTGTSAFESSNYDRFTTYSTVKTEETGEFYRAVYTTYQFDHTKPGYAAGTKNTNNNKIQFTIKPTGQVLHAPTEVTASKTSLYPGESTIISWRAADGAIGYNVYVKANGEGNGIKHNSGLVTATSYVLSNMDYSKNGHEVYVKAV